MKDLGEYLKTTRISSGVNMEEASEDLDIDISLLENIEEGNIRAFKDVYKLRDYIRQYAKYLGLDSEKVADEFNDFLFEHTSKISLDDILAEKKRQETKEEEERIKSPYTKEYKNKINIMPILLAFILSLLIALIVYVILNSLHEQPVRSSELMGLNNMEVTDEHTN